MREGGKRPVGLGGTRRRRQAATRSYSFSAARAGGTQFLAGGAGSAPGRGSAVCAHPRGPPPAGGRHREGLKPC